MVLKSITNGIKKLFIVKIIHVPKLYIYNICVCDKKVLGISK